MASLRLYYPLQPYYLNQKWGDNKACVINFGEPDQVVKVKIDGVCPQGYEELYPKFGMKGHNGLDLHSGVQPVYASCAGTVIEQQTALARGLGLGILTNEKYNFGIFGNRYGKLRYWHLKSFMKNVGDTVEVGDVLGMSDSTGYSSGNHLHFELQLFDKDAGGHPIQYFHPDMISGSIDPEPYFTGMYAVDYHKAISWTQKLVQTLSLLVAELQKPR